jgi:hypothetical protein
MLILSGALRLVGFALFAWRKEGRSVPRLYTSR